MKKLLTILGATGLVATTGATVVACGNPTKTEDPFKDIKDQFKWGIEAYEKEGLGIWPIAKDFTDFKESDWSKLIYTGILNADNYFNAITDFQNQKIDEVLHLTFATNLSAFNQKMNDFVKENGTKKVYLDNEKVKELGVGIKLDKDIQSWTFGKDEDNEENNKGKNTKSVIQAGEMKFTELTINFLF